jgi:hypothetical protein
MVACGLFAAAALRLSLTSASAADSSSETEWQFAGAIYPWGAGIGGNTPKG